MVRKIKKEVKGKERQLLYQKGERRELLTVKVQTIFWE